MKEWLSLPETNRREIIIAAAEKNRMSEQAVEKDLWVTFTLKAIFSTPWAQNLVFKGGTSLSKAWGLIQRFSEDIDLALDRSVLGFPKEFVSNSQVSKLRKLASKFIAGEFKEGLEKALIAQGLPKDVFMLSVQPTELSDRDPQVLELAYTSVITRGAYIKDKVIIEIGVRSEREPGSMRPIQSIIGATFPGQPYSDNPFEVFTIDAKRTFLEKAFLLHEGFLSKTLVPNKHDRKSRHIYDLVSIMETSHAEEALMDKELYSSIVEHRRHFTPERGIVYDLHEAGQINFIPPDEVIKQWEEDYRKMVESMIYGDYPDFKELILRLKQLLVRFRLSKAPHRLEILKAMAFENPALPEPKNGITFIASIDFTSDRYQPAGPGNETILYSLSFEFYQGTWFTTNVEIRV